MVVKAAPKAAARERANTYKRSRHISVRMGCNGEDIKGGDQSLTPCADGGCPGAALL